VSESVQRREWAKPEKRKIEAGSAEDDSGPSLDAIINPS
jgi:hypothetical protein